MGFKLPGKSMTSGTSGHSSALKMREQENAASALKQMEITKEELKGSGAKIASKDQDKIVVSATGSSYGGTKGEKTKLDPSKKHHKAILETRWKKGDTASGGTLNELVKQRKGLKKGTAEYAEVQNKINKALGSKKVHKVDKVDAPKPVATVKADKKVEKVISKGESKKEKITKKADKRIGEVTENVDVKTAKARRKEAKKVYGKGSKEHLKAKLTVKKSKATDIKGGKGGKKRGLFRGLATKINLKRQKKIQEKIDTKEAEENA